MFGHFRVIFTLLRDFLALTIFDFSDLKKNQKIKSFRFNSIQHYSLIWDELHQIICFVSFYFTIEIISFL